MSETGDERIGEASTTIASSLNAGNSNSTQGISEDSYAALQPSGEAQEGSKLPFNPPLEQSPSYFSLSSASSTGLSPPTIASANVNTIDNPGVVTPGTEIQEGRNTIESSAKIPPIPPRKDSDDISLSKIKPVHNFFGLHPVYPYDSDGSDGSLVFSPVSVGEDHKTPNIPFDTTKTGASGGTAIGKRNESSAPASSRARFGSVDSVASTGSIRYVRPSPVQASANSDAKQSTGPSQPINPQLLPYNERRKLIQQRQYEEQYQQYHAAMMQAHSQTSQQQHQQQGHPSHTPIPSYQMDPRMVAGYYQMYGMPPPGMYAPMPPHPGQHQQGGVPMNGYPFFPPQPGMPYYPVPNPAGTTHSSSHTHLHPSVQQFQQQNSSIGYQHQPYPSPLIPGHQVPPPLPSHYNKNNPSKVPPAHPSMTPQYVYYQPPPPPLSSPEQTQQREKQIRQHQDPQKPPQPRSGTLDRSHNAGKETETKTAIGAPLGGNLVHSPSSSTKSTNAKTNTPRLPPISTRRGSGSNIPPSLPPPPPPLPIPQSYAMVGQESSPYYHSRADSYESMSTLGSQSGSINKDEDDDLHSSHHDNIDPPKDLNSSIPSIQKPTEDTSITAPETPQQVGHARKNSFLDMLRKNWSPKSQLSPIFLSRERVNVDEFHRKNQEFLNRATSKPPIQKSSGASTILPMHHRRVGSEDRPPASRGTHRRLQSISNDEWEDGSNDKSSDSSDKGDAKKDGDFETKKASALSGAFKNIESDELSDSGIYTDEDRLTTTDDDIHDEYEYENANEMTSLLPSSGISSNEQEGKNPKHDRKSRRGRQHYDATSNARRKEHKRSDSNDFSQILGNMSVTDSSATKPSTRMSETTVLWDNRTSTAARKGRKKKYRKNSKYASNSGTSSSSENSQDSSDSDFDHRKWPKKTSRMFEKERAKLIVQWKAEARKEAELLRKEEEANRWYRRLWRKVSDQMRHYGVKTFRFLTSVESFIGNLPLTIGAVALAIVTLGVVWFKFAEEYLDTCERVHFHSSQCTFPEFPGCFYCDRSALGYRIAVGFHYTCTIIAGFLSMLLVAKILLATRVVIDEMSSPTTSSPAGLLCMTSVCVFAGRGVVGQVIVSTAACVHLALAIWFIYMALAYNIMPEPSWFPNTVGIGLSAVKVSTSSSSLSTFMV